MAARVGAVARIAQRERGKRVRLEASRRTSPRPRARAASPASAAKAYPLEGFLFPATYDFTARDDLARSSSRRS